MLNNLKFILFVFILSLSSVGLYAQKASELKIFKEFLGSGYDNAVANAVENSKKNAMFVVVASDDKDFTEKVKGMVGGHIASGRTRIYMILADKIEGTSNTAAIVANGKLGGIWRQKQKDISYASLNGMSAELGKHYDANIK